jgi:hypothetical protein
MRKLGITIATAAAVCAFLPASASAFGLQNFDVTFTQAPASEVNSPDPVAPARGPEVTQAGSHPYAMNIDLAANTKEPKAGELLPEESAKDLEIEQIPGFAGNPTAVPPCSAVDFLTTRTGTLPSCADGSAIGVVMIDVGTGGGHGLFKAPLYDLAVPLGAAAKLGFWVQSVPVTVEVGVSESAPYNIVAHTRGVSQVLEFFGAELTIWGNPAAPVHDEERGTCYLGQSFDETVEPKCPAGVAEKPFLTLPRACTGPLRSSYALDSWQNPGTRLANGEPNLADPAWATGSAETHDETGPFGFGGCGKLGFLPEMSAQPSTASASSAAGVDVSIDITDPGLLNPKETALADSDIREITTTFPRGVTLDPSAAEGLGVCTTAQYESASLSNQGCPDAAKLGSVEIETPVLEGRVLRGSVYLAAQNENPFGSLFAIYLLIRSPELGIFVKQAAEGRTDEATGQVLTTFRDIPQFPLSHVSVHLRSGPRAPLITPPNCGTYATTATMTPWSGGAPVIATSTFRIDTGPGGGPCPPATPPFAPAFEAGAENNAAGRYSPFDMRITRGDAEQGITRFSAVLPPGVVGKLAGVAKCSDPAIEAAKRTTGRAQLAAPSCPASSRIGGVVAGAGVGSDLTYVPGSLYLAGAYGGDPLSVVAIVPAVAGPFDVGTVVTREALTLNPLTAEVEVDGAASDPIPHLLKGIPLALRDLRVHVDRPDFTLNATGCHSERARATISGSGADPFNSADDIAVARSTRYQAAGCSSLGFAPKLTLKLKGGTRRAQHPSLRSTLIPRPGDANIGRAVVTLPNTEFIDNAHINNPCTRVQFNANQCPPSSVLGTAKAWTPLLDEPLEGPVYFRANGGERKLPDVVADLRGLVHITLVGFVDTATPKTNPRIRTTFATVPDAPVSKFTLNLSGGKKGLLVNSDNLCAKKRRATIELMGQNGRRHDTNPVLSTSCGGSKRGKRNG